MGHEDPAHTEGLLADGSADLVNYQETIDAKTGDADDVIVNYLFPRMISPRTSPLGSAPASPKRPEISRALTPPMSILTRTERCVKPFMQEIDTAQTPQMLLICTCVHGKLHLRTFPRKLP